MTRPLAGDNIRMAMMSLRASRWRSVLTMLGVIIGVTSVVTVVGIGEGIKRQIADQISQFGQNVLTIRADQSNAMPSGQLQGVPATSGNFKAKDIQSVAKTTGVSAVVPLGLVAAPATVDGRTDDPSFVLATTDQFPLAYRQDVKFGTFFDADSNESNVAVVGKNVAERLFGQEVPLGRSFDLLGEKFIVRGIYERFDESPISYRANMNNAIIIPYQRALTLTQDSLQTYQLLAIPTTTADAKAVQDSIEAALTASRGGQHNFVVETQEEALDAANEILTMLTIGIAAIAAISLLVGGVGIMNVMLVSVAERMHEIGIRKAIGATSRQIMSQFMIEAIIVSFTGGVIGVALALVITAGINVFTTFHALVNWPVALIAIGVSVAVGVVFGTAPAAKAARKDPIQALRHE